MRKNAAAKKGKEAVIDRINVLLDIAKRAGDSPEGITARRIAENLMKQISPPPPPPPAPLPTPPPPRGVPRWQTDPRFHSEIPQNAGFKNKNFCLKAIYDKSKLNIYESLSGGMGRIRHDDFADKKVDDIERVTFYAFDGNHICGILTAFCNKSTLFFAGQVMEEFSGTINEPHLAKAIVATFEKQPGKVVLVRLLGEDCGADRYIEENSVNKNPFGNPKFTDRLARLVASAEELS